MTSHFGAEPPRVLLVGGPYAGQSATITTLRNLFSSLPRESIAQVCIGAEGNVPDGIAESVAFVGAGAQPLRGFAQRFRRKRDGRGAGRSPTAYEPAANWRGRAHANLRALLDVSPTFLPRHIRALIERFRPSVVYSLLASSFTTSVAMQAARVAGAPLIPHFMDDWVSTVFSNGELAGLARLRLQRQVAQVANAAPAVFCISQLMAEEYQARFGKPCHAFLNCVDLDLPDLTRTRSETEAFVFCYLGNVAHGRAAMLRAMVDASEHALSRRDVRVLVHCSRLDAESRRVLEHPRVELREDLKDHEIPGLRSRANAMIHFDSFDGPQRRYFRLSLSTKIPLYMACGLPIFAVGPEDAGSMRYLREAGCGMVVHDLAELQTALQAFVADPGKLEAWGRSGRAAAEARHSRQQQSRLFADLLCQYGTTGEGVPTHRRG